MIRSLLAGNNCKMGYVVLIFGFMLVELVFALPALAYRSYPIPGFGFGVSEQGLSIMAFGQKFDNVQSIIFCAVIIAIACTWFLYSRIALGVCGCYCGPTKCDCTCGCREGCPCMHRDKSEHNDQGRRQSWP